MIANITSGKGFEGLLAYNENKIKSGDACLISKVNLITSKSVSVLSQFNMLDSRNTKKQNTTFHVSLNLPPGETVNDELFSDIADEYMKGMGYGDQPYVVYKHNDREHSHIHIISCKIQENGKSISDSWERTKSQRTCTEIEKMYGLNQTNRIKPKGDELKTDLKLEDIPNENMHLRDRFSTTIHEILEEKKPTTIREFKSELEKCNMSLVQSKGYSKNGNPIRGLKYFGLNENNKRDKYGIAASKLRLKPTLKYLDEKFKANLEFRKDIARKLRPQLNEIIKSFIKLGYADFDKQCQQKGINLNYHRNSSGIYGLSFIDIESGLEFKASDISKNLSWNVLKRTLNEDVSLKYEDVHTKLNKKGLYKFNTFQNQRYIEGKILLFKKKNYSSHQLLRALSLRGIEFEVDNKGQLLAYFNQLDKSEIDGYIIPKEIVNSVNKKNITDEISFQNSLSKYDNVDQRIMLNDALDRNDIKKVNFLMNNGVQYLLQNFEFDLIDSIDLNQSSSQYLEYESVNVSYDSFVPIKNVILGSNSTGEVDDEDDEFENIMKKKKRKRRLS
ncbi:relaxase/mobilization nuclease domain-containing protein [Labilibaculum sp. DW002]|uniref:Relaxase/mobilization nuclease domain-containing protein n=1 Tax=Paralabilibaculum antarcticum TaxID=2912572 RepID=A0ABT5VT70_9BACT|nr:relaxase/mobilization nuclease domain-containing protein [Labilibaculum sp. DW002]MDE5418486.1 relaxase/mobilization nuclease domain-containing protein [Labilibaculum sp. DW002]